MTIQNRKSLSAPRALRAALVSACLGAAALPASPALAADPPTKKPNPADAALAEALFNEARDRMRDKDYATACPKFAESYRLDPALGALLNLAACHEEQGKVATAWGEYRDAEAQALRAKDKGRQKFAAERAEALEPRLPKLVLTMQDPPANVELSRDGTTLGVASLGTPLPVDPGEHRITASAPGYKRWSTKVQAAEGRRVEVKIPPLAPAPDEPEASAPRAPVGPDRSAEPPPDQGWSGRTVAGVLVGAAGVAGLAVGGVFTGLTAAKKGDADAGHCSADHKCDAAGEDLIASAETLAWGANIGFGVGAALVVTGGVLLLTGGGSESTPAEQPAVSVLPMAGPRGGGLAARLRF